MNMSDFGVLDFIKLILKVIFVLPFILLKEKVEELRGKK